MRRIVVQHAAIDSDGFAWEVQVTIPWRKRADDDVDYGPNPGHGPETPVVVINTPNDPEHWSYGEDGPRFDLITLKAICAQADRAVERAKELEADE